MIRIEDKLNRKEYVNFIKHLITNSSKYKRRGDSKAYIIAVDSAWGTGKSYLVELLHESMNGENDYTTVKYNAWKNDYCSDAFSPLFYDILRNSAFDLSPDIIDSVESIVKAFVKDAYDMTVTKVAKTIGVTATLEATEEEFKKVLLLDIPILKKINHERASFEEFKTYLAEGLEKSNKHLVVIVDELDRCKPTFAIKTLEIAKHLFDVTNITFVFALDIEQLSHSIKCVYGQDMDAAGYLCRFFDYITKMPSADVGVYIENGLKDILQEFPNTIDIEQIKSYFLELYKAYNLSLRDLDTLLQSYKILLGYFLHKYKVMGAHYIYLFYLTMKYKRPQLFNKVFSGEGVQNFSELIKTESGLSKLVSNNKFLSKSIYRIDKTIAPRGSIALNRADGEQESDTLTILSIINDTEIAYRGARGEGRISWDISIDNVIFQPDLKKILDMGGLEKFNYKDYIHKQLEVYNFVDESTINKTDNV